MFHQLELRQLRNAVLRVGDRASDDERRETRDGDEVLRPVVAREQDGDEELGAVEEADVVDVDGLLERCRIRIG
jgi:hypothetical protein